MPSPPEIAIPSRSRSQGLNWERTYWAPVLEMKGDTFERLDPELFGTVQLK
jgi:hypothetical protein